MIDTIPQTATNTLSLYLQRNVIQKTDSLQIGFSQYEYLPTETGGLFFDSKNIFPVFSESIQIQEFAGDLLPFSSDIRSILFILLLLCFVIVAILAGSVGGLLMTNYRNLIVNRNRNRSAFKSQITVFEVWSEVFMVFQTILVGTISIFYVILWREQANSLFLDNAKIFLGIFLAISAFIAFKYVIYKIVSSTFKEFGLNDWATMYMRYLEILGLLLFLPTVFLLFLPEYQQEILILQIVIFFTTKTVSFISLLNIFVKNKTGILYYFLYLCAIEIAPYFLIYRGVTSMFM